MIEIEETILAGKKLHPLQQETLEQQIAAGSTHALVLLGKYYAFGAGDDADSALELFYQAAQLGSIDAMVELGALLVLLEAEDQALPWFEKAAKQDNTEALLYLGDLYAAQEPTPANQKKARAYYAKAAELGNPEAIRILAEGTMEGEEENKE